MDLSLLKKAKKGDSEAFISIIEENKSYLYRVAYSILKNDADVADAIQDTILLCWKNIDKLHNLSYFKTWLTRICINCCKQIIRKNQNIVYIDSYDGVESAEESNLFSKLCFQGIGETYKTILTLHYSCGFSIKEIAEMLNMKENTVKTRLSRGREAYKKLYLAEQGEILCKK